MTTLSPLLRNLVCGALGLTVLAPLSVPAAEAPNAAEAKLREGLRATMMQLRTAETERAALQAEKVEFEAKIKALEEKMAADAKAADDKQRMAESDIAKLKERLENQAGEIKQLQEELAKWKDGQKKAMALAETTEEKRARAAAEVIVLNRKVADYKAKNVSMHQLGMEILDRYAKFGLGAALTAREPFVGLTRVKFENLIQDYGVKLSTEKIKP